MLFNPEKVVDAVPLTEYVSPVVYRLDLLGIDIDLPMFSEYAGICSETPTFLFVPFPSSYAAYAARFIPNNIVHVNNTDNKHFFIF